MESGNWWWAALPLSRPPCPPPQVPGRWAPVFISGHAAHPLCQHPGPGPQAAALLPELR